MNDDDLLDRVYDDNGRAMHFRLVGQTPVPCSLREWAEIMEDREYREQRRVRLTRVGPYEVSTVFLGLDHQFGSGPPILFETMTFVRGTREDNPMDGRDCTWSEAEERHARAVEHMRANHCQAGEVPEQING